MKMASFSDDAFVRKLMELNNTAPSIQTLSLWLIHHRKHAKKIVALWFKQLRKAQQAKKLTLMYLANDVIQNSKKKGPDFNREFADLLPAAVRHVASYFSQQGEEKTLGSIERLINIWSERSVYDSTVIVQLKKNFDDGKKHHSKKAAVKNGEKTEPTPVTKKKKLEEVIAETEAEVEAEEPLDPPEADELVRALEQLEQSASGDATVRERISSFPPEVSDVSLLEKLKDKQEADKLAKQVEEAVTLLNDYNGRLAAELEERRYVSRMLTAFIASQRKELEEAQQRLKDCTTKLANVTNVRKELKSHLSNLPDLTLLPDVTGGLAPLPSAGDLFNVT